MSCNGAESPPGPVNDSVSIPIGFSNELQPQNLPDVSRLALFQSLSGFPMSCNLGLALVPQPGDLFQSLSGFPMSCNGGTVYRAADGRGVSIPIGFSNELQHGPCTCVVLNCLGFQSLSGFPMSCNSPRTAGSGNVTMFQSLSGFPMSCNGAGRGVGVPAPRVSIPIGFSNELQHRVYDRMKQIEARFQSLSGFPMSCNAGRRSRCCTRRCFNPYRVFQ